MTTQSMNHELSTRDRLVVELVNQFRQLTAGHLRVLAFGELASQTPCDRTLKRLVDSKYLMRLHRLIGGTKGGSAQYVYQLGRAGWKLGKHGEYWAPRAVNLHALAIADCYVTLKQAERDSTLEVIQFKTEPSCHQRVGNILLTPDAYVELLYRAQKLSSWLEVDRGTEHLSKIQEKLERYWTASTCGQWDGCFPFVLFIVPDEQRRGAIDDLVHSGPRGAEALFSVCTFVEFPRLRREGGSGAVERDCSSIAALNRNVP